MSVEIPLDNIRVALGLAGSVDFDLDQIATALTTGVKADLTLGTVTANANIHAGLDDIRIKEIGKIAVEATVKDVIRTDSKVDAGLDNIRITELPPIQLELSMRPIRIHLPLNYSFCFEFLGKKLFKLSFHGEGMIVTEDYKPRATEGCR
jgi:hypothetical protein